MTFKRFSEWEIVSNLISSAAICCVLAEIDFSTAKSALRIFHTVNPKPKEPSFRSNPLSINIFGNNWHWKCVCYICISKEQIDSDEHWAFPQKSNLVWLPQPCLTPFQTCRFFLSTFWIFGWVGVGVLVILGQYPCFFFTRICLWPLVCSIQLCTHTSRSRFIIFFLFPHGVLCLPPGFLCISTWISLYFDLDLFLTFGLVSSVECSYFSIKVHYFLCLTESSSRLLPHSIFSSPPQ